MEAGAQGEHKIQRGYQPTLTHSAHWLQNPALREAVESFLHAERPAILAEAQSLSALTPYRQDGAPDALSPRTSAPHANVTNRNVWRQR